MADGRITSADIIDAEGIERDLIKVQGDLEKLKQAIQNTAKGLRIEILSTDDLDALNKFARGVQTVTECMEQWKNANRMNKEALDGVRNALKAQVDSAKAEQRILEEIAKSETRIAEAKERERAKTASANAKAEASELRLQRAKANNNKLTREEIASLEEYKRKIAEVVANTSRQIESVDVQQKSYNELYATYNALKDALNGMTVSEREETAAGKSMTAQAYKMMEAMNKMQQSTGKFTLNVGNYRSAFDGLGYSIQQVVREIPSAINLNQFFLAISNNIPMVVDQMKLFRTEQNNISAQLATMQKGSKEYMALQAKQMSAWQKWIGAIINWNTAVIAVLMLLKKYGAQVIESVVSSLSKTSFQVKALKEVNEGAAGSIGEMTAKYMALRKEYANLQDSDKDKWIKHHADDWKELGIKVGDAKTAEDVYTGNTRKIMDAINARARSMAAMELASKKYQEAFEARAKAEKEFSEGKTSKASSISRSLASAGMAEAGGTLTAEQQSVIDSAARQAAERRFEEAKKAADKMEAEAYYYIATWVDDKTLYSDKDKNKKEKEAKYTDMWKEYMQNRSKLIKDAQERETEAENDGHEVSLKELKDSYNEKLEALKEYATQNHWDEKKIEEEKQKLFDQYNTIRLAKDAEHQRKLKEISDKYELIRIESEISATKVTLEESRKRVRTRTDEQNKNASISRNIANLKQQLVELEKIDTAGVEEGEKKKQEAIETTNELIAKQRNSFDFTKQLKNFSKISDIFSDKVFDSAKGHKRGLLETMLGTDLTEVTDEKIDSMFEQWFDAASDAIQTWWSSTIDYIGDVADAWVSLQEAKSESAQKEVESAQEAYEKEKALMEAGYASRIDAAWEEYQEKKKIQEQASKDSENAAKVQKALDTAQQASSMITAIANLYKTLSAGGAVGVAMATALSATMIASFTASKVLAYQATKYGEGGFETVEQGGSHASGNDTELGVMNRHGRRMVVERNEGIGVFNTRAMRRYGRSGIEALVKSVNNGTYGQMAVADMESNRRLGTRMLTAGGGVNLKALEKGVAQIAEQGKVRTVVDKNGRIVETIGNVTRIYE